MMVSICGSDHFREFFGGVGRHSFPLKAIGCSKTQLLAFRRVESGKRCPKLSTQVEPTDAAGFVEKVFHDS